MSQKGLWLGAALTAGFLALAFRGVDLASFGQAVTGANYWYVGPSLLATATGYVVRTVRWREILATETPLGLPRLGRVLVIGFASNNVLPARLGELVRAMLLQRHSGVRKSFAIATIVLERMADGLTLLLVLVVLSAADLVPGVPGQFAHIELLTGFVFVGLSAFVALALAKQTLTRRALSLLLGPLPLRIGRWVTVIVDGFLEGLVAIRSWRRLAAIAALSVLVWTLEGLSYLALTAAFDLPLHAGSRIVLACTVLVLVNLSIMIPSAPGYVGTFDFVGSYAVRMFGVAPETALAFVIVAHALQYVLVTGAGLAFFANEHLAWNTLLLRPSPVPETARVARPDERSKSVAQ